MPEEGCLFMFSFNHCYRHTHVRLCYNSFTGIPKCMYDIIPISLISLHARRYEAPVQENMHKQSFPLAGWSLRGDIR